MTYKTWRSSYQSDAQAARAAYAECMRLQARVEETKGHLPYEAIEKILTEVMDIAAANGADSRSMPDEYVEVAAWLCGIPSAQPAPSIKDDIIDDLQSQFDTEGITEHDSGDALIRLSDAIAAVEDNFAQPTPSSPEGWKEGVEAVAAMLQKKADDYAEEYGYGDMGVLSFGEGMCGQIKMDYYSNLVELTEEVRAMLTATTEAKP